MSDDKRLAAAFFLSSAEHEPIQALLARAGATDIADGPWDPEDSSGLVACRCAGMTCKAFLDERPAQRLLVIFFSQSAFLRMLPDEPGDASQEAAAPLLEAFVQACEALRPDAALVVTHPHQADVDELWRLGGLILEADAGRLAAERYGLLFISDKLVEYQDVAWSRPDRDELPVAGGTLLFAGRGSKRWW